jgi:hypothetical protein
MTIPILTYHKVDTKFEFGITRVSPSQFERHIKFFNDQGYKALTVSEARNLKRVRISLFVLPLTMDMKMFFSMPFRF